MMNIKFFKKEKSFQKKDFALNPDFYWKIALLVAAAVISVSLVLGYFLFTQIEHKSSKSVASETNQIPSVDPDLMKKVLNYFSDRQTNSTQIINSPAPVVDPSL